MSRNKQHRNFLFSVAQVYRGASRGANNANRLRRFDGRLHIPIHVTTRDKPPQTS